jgi:hypothetical protein
VGRIAQKPYAICIRGIPRGGKIVGNWEVLRFVS